MKRNLFLVDTTEIIRSEGDGFKAIYVEAYSKYLKMINVNVEYEEAEELFENGDLYVSIKFKDNSNKSALVYISFKEECHTLYLNFIDVFKCGNDRKYIGEYYEVIDL